MEEVQLSTLLVYGRPTGSYPETRFEEIGVTESLFLEADFWPGPTSGLPVIRQVSGAISHLDQTVA